MKYVIIKKIENDKLDIKIYKVIGPKKRTKTLTTVEKLDVLLTNIEKQYVVVNPNNINPLRDYNNQIQYYTRYSCNVVVQSDETRIEHLKLDPDKNKQVDTFEKYQEVIKYSPTFSLD